MNIKKISWFRRLFWSWDRLEKYILEKKDDEKINLLQNYNNELTKDKENLIKDKEFLKTKNENLVNEIHTYKAQMEEKEKNLVENKGEKIQLKKELEIAAANTNLLKNSNNELKTGISEKLARLDVLDRINKTFFQSGNKGKGILGELQIENILEKSGISNDFWTKNLMVGKTKSVVEFAIKSGQNGKWIPIDSKVIETEMDEDNKPIINDKYAAKVKTQAGEIEKYLSKHNTTHYGVLVLQNDNIYLTLYEHYPELFQNILRDKKIYIASPSSFVQMAWSINEIVEIYNKVKSDKDIYDSIISALDSVCKFANNLKDTQTKFNIALDTHFPTIEKKYDKLRKKIDKTGKLKDIKSNKQKGITENNGESKTNER